MKKLAAILLMAVFMFNLFGYKLWVYYAEQHADNRLENVVDNNQYDDAGLLVITKPINLPYYNNTTAYTAANGEVEINGVYYKYVKCRIYNNQMEMLCLPNTVKTNIKNARDDYFGFVAGIQKNSNEKNKSPENSPLKKSFSDFDVYGAVKPQYIKEQIIVPYPASQKLNLGLLHKASAEQPPDTLV